MTQIPDDAPTIDWEEFQRQMVAAQGVPATPTPGVVPTPGTPRDIPGTQAALTSAIIASLVGGGPQRGSFTDKTTGALWAWQIINGKPEKQQITEGTGEEHVPDLRIIDTDRGKLLVDINAAPAGSILPGTQPAAKALQTTNVDGKPYAITPDDNSPSGYRLEPLPGAAAPAPAAPTSISNTPSISVWNPKTGQYEQKANEFYVPPTPPQGPAFSGTAAGMDYASKLRREEAIAEAQVLIDKEQKFYDLGFKMTPEREMKLKAQLDAIATQYHQDVAEYNRQAAASEKEPYEKLTVARTLQADARAAQAAKAQGAQVQAAGYSKQAERGMGLVQQATQAGVGLSSNEYGALYFDPHTRAQELLLQAAAQPAFDPHQQMIDTLSQQIMERKAPVPVAPAPLDFSKMFAPAPQAPIPE